MATKATIITDINTKIIPNGNIRATDTNRILKNILNCDELNTSTAVNTFKFEGNVQSNNGINVSYSIRGIIELFANITLRIDILETNVNTLSFPHNNKDLVAALDSIIKENQDRLDFLVKIENKNTAAVYKKLEIQAAKVFRIGNLNFGFNTTSLQISVESQEPNDKLFNGDSISTSFSIHRN